MGKALADFGLSVLGQVAGAGMGMMMQKSNDKRQMEQQRRLQNLQISGNKEMIDYQKMKDLEMWNNTNYGAQMKHLKEAGLNPGLLYGMSGGGGVTTGGSGGGVSGGSAPQGGGEVYGMMQNVLQARMTEAQIKLAESQAKKNEVEAAKTAGVDTENVSADTQNKILQSVIFDFAGKESKDMYERVMSPNRMQQAETYSQELSARTGIAGTIYEMWLEGKLKEGSLAEVEQKLLQNAKTREETRQIYKQIELIEENTKGKKLENIITELEGQLQKQTGIDRNSPYWLKILGRLFVGLTN